jgi:hypothetical protein
LKLCKKAALEFWMKINGVLIFRVCSSDGRWCDARKSRRNLLLKQINEWLMEVTAALCAVCSWCQVQEKRKREEKRFICVTKT